MVSLDEEFDVDQSDCLWLVWDDERSVAWSVMLVVGCCCCSVEL